MELREFLQLFVRRQKLVFTIAGIAIVIGFLGYRLQGQWYDGVVLLSVTRQGTEVTPEYQYDHSYRLQADERMADTVARYLESEVGRHETARRALMNDTREIEFVESKISALRLSSNLIRVSYRAKTPTESERIAAALHDVGERYVASLNEQAASRNWFTLVASDAISRDGRFTLPFALAIGLFAGLFIAFWSVIVLWYWKGEEKR